MNARDLADRRWKPRSGRARWVFGISVFAIASSAALFALSSVMWYKLDIEQGDEHGWSLILTDGCIYF